MTVPWERRKIRDQIKNCGPRVVVMAVLKTSSDIIFFLNVGSHRTEVFFVINCLLIDRHPSRALSLCPRQRSVCFVCAETVCITQVTLSELTWWRVWHKKQNTPLAVLPGWAGLPVTLSFLWRSIVFLSFYWGIQVSFSNKPNYFFVVVYDAVTKPPLPNTHIDLSSAWNGCFLAVCINWLGIDYK